MGDKLIGIDTKIERAKEQIIELQAAVDVWGETKPYEVIEYSEVDTKTRVWCVEVRHDVPPKLGAIAGDVINNLRSSLDYLMCELVGGRAKNIYFPIRASANEYKGGLADVKRRISKAAMDLLKATEAHKGGNGHALWQLNHLNNLQKHRLLMPVASALHSVAVDIGSQLKAAGVVSSLYPSGLSTLPSRNVYPLENGTVLYWVRAAAWSRGVGVNPHFTVNIAFGKDTVIQGQAVLPTLMQFADFVEGTIKPFRPLLT